MSGIMSKLKLGPSPSAAPSLENNPITQYFEVGKECCTAGPGLVWRVHDAYRKSDGKECSVFVFDKRIADKVYKPKRKESMLERLRYCIAQLEKLRHPKMLQIIHSIEEGQHTIAFASEPVMASLHNVLAWQEAHASANAAQAAAAAAATAAAAAAAASAFAAAGPSTSTASTSTANPGPHSTPLPPNLITTPIASTSAASAPPIHPVPGPSSTLTLGPAPTPTLGPSVTSSPSTSKNSAAYIPTPPVVIPPFAKDYTFLDVELRYGLLQIIEALNFLHYNVKAVHRNVNPQVIIINKRGTWKLFGLEFTESIAGPDPTEMLSVPPWSIKVAKIAQPNLDYVAPEVQTNGQCNILSDMFSLGLVICALFNNGRSVIQANNNPVLYMKQLEYLEHHVCNVVPRVPAALQEAVSRLLSRDPHPRPTTQLLPLIKYFKCQSETAIAAMQFLDIVTMKDPNQKAVFYRTNLIDALPYIPKKLRYQHVWPCLQLEVRTGEVLAAVLQPIFWLTSEASDDEFTHFVYPTLKNIMNSPKSVQATVTILDNLLVVLKKCNKDEIERDVLPLLYNAIDSNSNQIQCAALIAIQKVHEYIDDRPLHYVVIVKVRALLEKNQSDVKIISLILGIYEIILLRLDRMHVLEQVIPTLLAMKLTDPDIINRVVNLYKCILREKKFSLTASVMATKLIPNLTPQAMNPSLTHEHFNNLMEILFDMLEHIDKNQRYKLRADGNAHASPDRFRLRHQMSTDNMVAPPFNIPNLRVEQRKTSSAEDMARKNSMSGPSGAASVGGGFKRIGQWFFGSSQSTNNDNNFLRVSNAFPNRRLSDNTLMTPKIRIAPSCASSPGGTPGGSTSGLPTRRHSSIGPQERRGSAVNLSPPTGYQYRGRGGSGSSLSVPSTSHCVGGSMPNTSSSVPFLLTSSMQSIRSRRPSTCLSASQGSGILQQLSSGVVRHLPMSASKLHMHSSGHHWSVQGATAAGYSALQHTAMAVRKCPSLNITLTR